MIHNDNEKETEERCRENAVVGIKSLAEFSRALFSHSKKDTRIFHKNTRAKQLLIS
jgi:hypothetical protein